MADLKSIRLSAQEIIEDDATGKGSSSRFSSIYVILTLCWCLMLLVYVKCYLDKDVADLIKAFIAAITIGGPVVYGAKRDIEVYKGGSNAPPQDPPQGSAQ